MESRAVQSVPVRENLAAPPVAAPPRRRASSLLPQLLRTVDYIFRESCEGRRLTSGGCLKGLLGNENSTMAFQTGTGLIERQNQSSKKDHRSGSHIFQAASWHENTCMLRMNVIQPRQVPNSSRLAAFRGETLRWIAMRILQQEP